MRIAVGRQHLKHALVDGEQRDVKSATAKIEHKDVFLRALLVQTICNRSGSWLIDHAHDVEPGNDAGILGCLALRVIEVRRHSHDSVFDRLSKILFSNTLHLAKHHRRDFFG
mmetsp:Transcript_3273/g.9057  ORF Transcript_3273/g.9057 Transcript_3273/m.9057 type:complete len:112 (-) Transcript_3273:731-1066(-)